MVTTVPCVAPVITPLASMLIVLPSTFTPPNIVVLAIGNVYSSAGVKVNLPFVLS